MKVSELWLKSFIDLKLPMTDLANQLTQAGIEVEHLEGSETAASVMTLKIPPNRGDCLSMEGIVRELSMANDRSYLAAKPPEWAPKIEDKMTIRVMDGALCPRYLGCIVKGITPLAPVPEWMKERLESAGIKSISGVVDVLNYVMLELGQPLHAFDLHTLAPELCVRKSSAGESMTLLNGTTVALKEGTLVIADQNQIHAMAGIMGSLGSSVREKTEDIYLESAYFNPIAIRLSAQHYALKTEASYRFERAVDPHLQRRALQRTVQLLLEITGGQPGPIVEVIEEKSLPSVPAIVFRKNRLEALLGIQFTEEKVLEYLHQLHMNVQKNKAGEYTVRPPSFRQDIELEIDLIEEIARLYGFHRLPTAPLTGERRAFPIPEAQISTQRFKDLLVDRGFSEAITYSFIDPLFLEKLGLAEPPFRLSNPISQEMAVMRTSLWPGLLQAVQHNQRRQLPRARLFEIGACFFEGFDGPLEKEMLAGIGTGPLYKEQWGLSPRLQDFYDLKIEVEALLALSQLPYTLEKAEHPVLHPGQTAAIRVQGVCAGYIGTLHPALLKALELTDPVVLFELDLARIKEGMAHPLKSLSKFPAIRRDIAIVLDKELEKGQIEAVILNAAGPLLQEVIFFDVYEGNRLPAHKKSMAIGLILQHASRTLIEEEITEMVQKILGALQRQCHATLRE